ncbi:hypothetical protein GVO57_13985 (plasmid) [Sphingomonas changnyeongensis]|uniref:Uncharacterized protein n=1 Tax=Sphingomonas changnyeongensis TaxID=2698679 RepID=A0A7Z2NY51_9SPHN|nr:hypothetical protein [Sphingomonas changnyeongensis]QHL92003.1 hypothetical protein GVO57_13985 [Sphingomonas changnyeongensis]
MAMKRGWWFAAAACVAALAGTRASGSGDPGPILDYVTSHALHPIDRAAFAAGNVGIVKPSAPAAVRYLDWRLLTGLETGTDAARALTTPCCGDWQDLTGVWLEARRQVPGLEADYYWVSTERQGPDYTSIPTCFGDAFTTAAATLKARIAAHGATSLWVRAWVDAQDRVFEACSKDGITLPPLDPGAPAWLRADRAYQQAALALYDGRLADAEAAFAAIGRDPTSPWHKLALYLQARTIQRAALTTRESAAFARAHAAIATLAAAPDGTYGRGEVVRMQQVLDYHEHPAALRDRLDRVLNAKTPTPDIAVQFKDYWSLSANQPDKPEAADWIATLGARNREEGLAHATGRWQATHRTAWLVAALGLARPDDAGALPLLRAADRVAADDPAWLTARYHLLRLRIGRVPDATLRPEVDALLARRDLTPSDRNIFLSIRAQLATSLADFTGYALRQPYCKAGAGDCAAVAAEAQLGQRGQDWLGLGDDARMTIDRLPLAERLALGRSARLPTALRLDLTLTNYVRAVLLRRDAAVNETARMLVTLLPQVKADWQRILRTPPGPAKRFAEIFVMTKIPSLRTDLADYARPHGDEASFGGYWDDWFVQLPRGMAPAAFPAAKDYYECRWWDGGAQDDAVDLTCNGRCGEAFPARPASFARPMQAAARSERSAFRRAADLDRGKTGGTTLWEEALAYVTAHPRDPRAGEALYRLNRVGRWGNNHNQLSKRAFRLLHARYPGTVWAQRSPYYYN